MAESIPITEYKDLRKLRTTRPQNRDPARSNLRTIHALDTETYQGNVFLIADSDGRFLDDISAESIIKFLFHKKYQNSWNFFYNIDYDVGVILKLLGNELYKYKRKRKLEFEFQGYKLSYFPNKCFKIQKGHHSAVFFDIAQFYDHKGLSVSYQENIALLDPEYLEIKSKRAEFSPTFYRRNTRRVRNYCIQDCILTKALAEHWIKLFHDAFGFYPSRWISSGYLSEKVLINNKIGIPRFDSTPYKVNELAYRCYFGGRFEMLKRGFIGTAFLYDVNSAYPHSLTQFPDLTNGKWIRRKSIHPESKLGFFRILADIPDCEYVPPFPFRKNGILIFPTGKFETYCTLAELQACKSQKWFKILDSYQFVPSSNIYPYKDFIERLYQKRLELKRNGDPLQLPIKIILNSIYGKTGQKTNRRIGNMFNPVLFAFITGFTRSQLYRFVIENHIEREAVAFATDSICVTKKLDIDSVKLGDFSLSNSANDVYYLQNGFYRFGGKWKQRGLGKLGSKEIENIDAFERKGKLYYKFRVLRNSRLRSSILQDTISNIGKIKEIEREIDLNADKKRLWLEELSSIDSKEINESTSISLNFFK
jgi:hypothetical protein